MLRQLQLCNLFATIVCVVFERSDTSRPHKCVFYSSEQCGSHFIISTTPISHAREKRIYMRHILQFATKAATVVARGENKTSAKWCKHEFNEKLSTPDAFDLILSIDIFCLAFLVTRCAHRTIMRMRCELAVLNRTFLWMKLFDWFGSMKKFHSSSVTPRVVKPYKLFVPSRALEWEVFIWLTQKEAWSFTSPTFEVRTPIGVNTSEYFLENVHKIVISAWH